jgi:hypothetical protein
MFFEQVTAMAPAAEDPVMSLDGLLAFDPNQATSTEIAQAIQDANTLVAGLTASIAQAAEDRPSLLLTASDEEVVKQDRELERARRDAERLAVLVQKLNEALSAQQGMEAVEDLRRLGMQAQEAHDALSKWQRVQYEKLRTSIAEGLQLEADALSKRMAFEAATAEAYRRIDVREAGPLGINLPPLSDNLPSLVFPNWAMPA